MKQSFIRMSAHNTLIVDHVVDTLLEVSQRSLKVNVKFHLEDGTYNVMPALVSKEVRPLDAKMGEWRITMFDEDLNPLMHANFWHDNMPFTPKSVEAALTADGGMSALLGCYNSEMRQTLPTDIFSWATNATIEPGSPST